ncbi:DEAD-box ATP-dependent RNA helicase 26 [Tetrabaena socialis]|uniref:DEAD-box ATP-dependent RNA helicase 26 n=1 Tax=Tetrabaena socialis TaxID=47790 RepID=A0A2J8ACR0_9CHLO|nr:DEAD-box ATP-dependent RNA helicase 26 [Tetrabaena socialis]|eukprot:PNH10302.1 DEAD-box ATP-dependent RNA helicase 26 [Tetrabaena socialis]
MALVAKQPRWRTDCSALHRTHGADRPWSATLAARGVDCSCYLIPRLRAASGPAAGSHLAEPQHAASGLAGRADDGARRPPSHRPAPHVRSAPARAVSPGSRADAANDGERRRRPNAAGTTSRGGGQRAGDAAAAPAAGGQRSGSARSDPPASSAAAPAPASSPPPAAQPASPSASASPVPASCYPLSPATARALARGFRPGDLALSSARPLQALCGSRHISGSQQQQPHHSPPRAGDTGGAGTTLYTPDGGPGPAPAQPAVGPGGDMVVLGPAGAARDLGVLVAAVEKLLQRPAGRGCVGCVLLAPSRERAECLQEAAFTLLAERGGMAAGAGGGDGSMHVLVKLGGMFSQLRVLVLDGGEVLAERHIRRQIEQLLRLLPNTALSSPTARQPPSRGGPPTKGTHREPPPPHIVTLLAATVPLAARPSPPNAPPQAGPRGDGAAGAAGGRDTPPLLPPDVLALASVALRAGYAVVDASPAASLPPLYDRGPPAAAAPAAEADGTADGSLAAAVAAVLRGTALEGPPYDASTMHQLALPSAATADVPNPALPPAPASSSPPAAAAAPAASVPAAATSAAALLPPVPLHILAVPLEDHLSYLYVVVRQHMMSEGRHKVLVQFPSASLAALYASLFQALGFPVAEAHSRTSAGARQAAVGDFAAGPRGLLFASDLGGTAGGVDVRGLTLVVWVGLPRSLGTVVQMMGAVRMAAAAAAWPAATTSGRTQPPRQPDTIEAAARVASRAGPASSRGGDSGDRGDAAAVAASPVASPGVRCLLVLTDVDEPAMVAAAANAAMVAAGHGWVIPMSVPMLSRPGWLAIWNDGLTADDCAQLPVVTPMPGAWAGPLEAVQRRISDALAGKVPAEAKQGGLEGLLGHMSWVSVVSEGTKRARVH